MKRIIYSQYDGTVAIVIPAPEFIEQLVSLGMTEEDAIEYIRQKDVPQGVSSDVVPEELIPTDRTFRGAWVKDNASVKTDIPKAKLIAHDKRRAKRAEEFAPLDIEATIPSKANQAEAARQAIRDKHATMQTAIDTATTEAELKQILSEGGVL